MKTKLFEILNLYNFNTKVVPEMFLTHMDVNQIGLPKIAFQPSEPYIYIYIYIYITAKNYYFFNAFSAKNVAFV